MGKSINRAFLMHKNHMVMDLEINESGGIKPLHFNPSEKNHIPIGGQMNNMKLHDWWNDRSTPKTRQGAKTALNRLGYSSAQNMLVDNLALSLTDCYWIKPFNLDVSWDDVNLFDNEFEDYFGIYTFNASEKTHINNKTVFSPATSQGEVQKKWCIDKKNTRFMVKGNYGDNYQQSINEVFATQVYELLDFKNHTSYSLTSIITHDNRPGLGCSCDCFCNNNTELISAWEVLQTTKYKMNESLYYPFRDVCINLGIKEEDFDYFISYEIMIDFLISNTDRHMNNIAILRNPDTLEIKGMAPIFDNGNSMFYRDSLEALKRPLRDLKTHSFIESERKLLKYVKDRHIIDLNALNDVSFEIYKKDILERHERIPYIKKRFEQKLHLLDEFQHGKDIWKYNI